MVRDHLHQTGNLDRYETNDEGVLVKPWLTVTVCKKTGIMMVYAKDRQYGFLVPRSRHHNSQFALYTVYFWVGVALDGHPSTLPPAINNMDRAKEIIDKARHNCLGIWDQLIEEDLPLFPDIVSRDLNRPVDLTNPNLVQLRNGHA